MTRDPQKSCLSFPRLKELCLDDVMSLEMERVEKTCCRKHQESNPSSDNCALPLGLESAAK